VTCDVQIKRNKSRKIINKTINSIADICLLGFLCSVQLHLPEDKIIFEISADGIQVFAFLLPNSKATKKKRELVVIPAIYL